MIKVVDVFAGPGGLGEGFSRLQGGPDIGRVFDVALSIEKEGHAFDTLLLRKFYWQFPKGAPASYYDHLRGVLNRAELFALHSEEAAQAQEKCWHATLGPDGEAADKVRARIDEVTKDRDNWVLIGGPPCQAYSLVGRSRNRGNPTYDPKLDSRQTLYVEYLQILAEHRPAVFVMENVKGLLSAKLEKTSIFERILTDLANPGAAIRREERSTRRTRKGGYRIYSLVDGKLFDGKGLRSAVVRSEDYGVPQARHRVILLGVRDDIPATPRILQPQPAINVQQVIGSLPKIRSGLNKKPDQPDNWKHCVQSQSASRWTRHGTKELQAEIRRSMKRIAVPRAGRGGEFVASELTADRLQEWLLDRKIGGACNHSSRGHMPADLHRYFYAACYAKVFGRSPGLEQFPEDLLPHHRSVRRAIKSGGHFSDRFRVQLADRPSTTIVSHISKDGHYYIHPDPVQCRSLTVREAARLQTFPDNYLFTGPRTAQYVQVGNAVPPFLANQIAAVVFDLLVRAGALD